MSPHYDEAAATAVSRPTTAGPGLKEEDTMGCNCGGRSRRTVTVYRLILPNGGTRDYATLQEAHAAKRRMGNGGRIVAVNQ